ncbi:PAS domain-containing protein [Isoptericola sp. NEAU-Y5]|uniref:PAS domain-containing protein n=1 Tax=Isoptericola luteus TaxID=2879484 RepID=A0ABS7ZKS8_9MICO|nr:PAS domain-containing protein [Isoptericola sp. NEAU-Y5]MCA5894249.1 PAS domain-containing protein [Isoptericola sp. NEAU-Y5]
MSASTSSAHGGPLRRELVVLAELLGAGTQLLVGRYRVDAANGAWWWSDEVFMIFGREAGKVEPGPEVLRAHLHPDDRDRLSRTASVALASGKPFAGAHRIVDDHGRTRTVVITGQGRHDEDGRVTQVVGYVIDASPVPKDALDREAQRAVSRAFVAAAAAERAKGAIMAVCGVDESVATEVLADAGAQAGISAQTAGVQMMAALAQGAVEEGERTREHEEDLDVPRSIVGAALPGEDAAARLSRALATVHPVDRPHGHDAQLARRRPRAGR